jgi:hypothetical protein
VPYLEARPMDRPIVHIYRSIKEIGSSFSVKNVP